MLISLLVIPLIGILIIGFISDEKSNTLIKQVTLLFIIISFIISVVLWLEFDSNNSNYQFISEFNSLSFCHLHIGIDGISLYFILLTTFLIPIAIISNWDFNKNYALLFLLLESLLLVLFSVLDLILFYIFFESVLIPLYIIVGHWGGNNSIRAAYILFLYTLAGSLFILLSIITIYYYTGTTDFIILSLESISFDYQKYLWLGFFLSIAVKTPLVPFHIWLPKAHAEAPLAGSIVLAGLILKLAVYGFLRILLPLLPDATSYFTPLVQIIAVISLIYSSLATLRQTDTKALVAYSSIGHIAIVVLGVFSNTLIGIEGSIILSLAHGFVSPAIFLIFGGILYNRTHSRIIRYYRGLTIYAPILSALFFVTTTFNIAVPLSLNWIGEFISLAGVFSNSPIIGFLSATSIILSASYSIFLFNRVSFGSSSKYLKPITDVNRTEFIILISLLLPAFILGIIPNVVLNDLHITVSQLIY